MRDFLAGKSLISRVVLAAAIGVALAAGCAVLGVGSSMAMVVVLAGSLGFLGGLTSYNHSKTAAAEAARRQAQAPVTATVAASPNLRGLSLKNIFGRGRKTAAPVAKPDKNGPSA